MSSKPDPPSKQLVWSVCDNNGLCSRGLNVSHAVICRDGDNTIEIQNCCCMFYDEDTNTSLLSCSYQKKLELTA